ncbi:TY4B-J, partial [Symbiodinium sp. KB8]
METVIKDPGKRLMIEVFAGSATVTKVARGGNKWMACPPVDKKYGWDLSRPKDQKNLLGWIKKCQPDLVTLDPPCGPWCGQSSEGLRQDELWERRRLQLPFWRLVAEVWRLQDEAGTLVVVTQPALSQAMHLSFMQDRENVHRVYVPMCSFGLCDPETRQPYEKTMVIEANNGEFLRHLLKGAYCKHGRCGHQSTKGYCKVAGGWARRSDEAARWPEKFGRALLQAADEARVHATAAADWQLHAATSGAGWETMAVASHEVPDEGLRQELARHSMTGERYDFICYDGAANQQPRRLRALVAHLHVTMGHLSNERLSRMLRLSGAKEAAVQLAQALRCQVCAMTRPPLPTPQVAYQKPRSFNERVSGDSFFVWDASGQRFAATHFIDALTDYQVGDLTDTPDSSFAREVFQDLWLSVFGPPDLLITDGGSEFKGGLEAMLDLFGVVHEITPEGAKWRLGQAERHGAVLKLMVMKLVKGMGLKGLKDMRHALLASVAAKNRTLNRGGVSPMQAVTGRNNMIPGSLMQQLSSGQVRFKYNEAVTTSEAVARAERIRIGAIEAFHWLDSHDALRRALASRSRPPHMEGVREGATVYVYDPPANRRGLARRMQDNSSWTGPGIIVCVERDKPIPQRIWVRVRGRVKAFPLEKLRLATVDEMTSADYVTQAVQDVEKELQGGHLRVEAEDDGTMPTEDGAGRANAPDESSSSSSSSADDEQLPEEDAEARAEREERVKLLDDLPYSVARNLEDKRKREQESTQDPHALDFQKKQKLFEELAKQLNPPSTLEEAGIRKHLGDSYAKFKSVKKVIMGKSKASSGRSRGDGGHMEAIINDTVGQWALWSAPSLLADHEVLVQVSRKVQEAEMEGAFIEPLKKAVGVYLEHKGIKGVPADQLVDPTRVIGSRFVLTNKGAENLSEAELKARWVFGGHRDPDAGLYATASPTASVLGHNLLNFVAVQMRWVVYYEDVSAAFLQGKQLPRAEKVFVKVPHGYPPAVTEFLIQGLGGGVRPDLVEPTKGGFGLPESPRLWYLEYKDTIEGLGLKELALVPGLFRAFHPCGKLRAMASIHVDDTRYAGDESSQQLWDELHAKLKFGKQRKATDGWQKFCGRWERQDPQTLEMEY